MIYTVESTRFSSMSHSAFPHTSHQFLLLNLSSFNPHPRPQPMYPLLSKQHQSRAQIQQTGDLMTWSDVCHQRWFPVITIIWYFVIWWGYMAAPAGAGCDVCLLSLNWLGKYKSRWPVDLVICLNFVLHFNTGIREMKWGCVCWCNKCVARWQTMPWVLRMSKVIWEL